MKILVSQKGKKLTTEFHYNGKVESYNLNRAEDFLVAVDNFLKKSHTGIKSLKKAELEFENVGILTERIILAIMKGLTFGY